MSSADLAAGIPRRRQRLKMAAAAAAVAFIAAALAARFYALDADPDVTLTWSKVFYTDEQGYSSNAVRKYVSGDWRFGCNDHMVIMPVVPCLQYLLFRAAGLSLAIARFPSAALGTFAMIIGFLFLWARPRGDPRAAPAYFFLAATNYYYLVYSRVALTDVPMYAFGLCSGYAFFLMLRAGHHFSRRLLCVVSGALLGLCVLAKTSGVLFLAVIPLSFVLMRVAGGKPASRQDYSALAGVILVAAAVVLFALTLTSRLGYDVVRLKEHGIDAFVSWDARVILRHYAELAHNGFLKANAGVLLLAFAGCSIVMRRAARQRGIYYGDAFFSALMAAHLLLHGFFGAQEPRYFVALSIPAAYFTCRLFEEIAGNGGAFAVSGRRGGIVSVLVAVMLAANAWNMLKVHSYFSRLEYSMRDFGGRLVRDIAADAGPGAFIIAGRFAPLAGLTGANPVDIVCDQALLPEQTPFPVYVLDWDAAARPVDVPAGYVLTGRYRILKGYNGAEFRLFRRTKCADGSFS